MNRYLATLALAVLVLMMVACRGEEATPTPEPTAVPPEPEAKPTLAPEATIPAPTSTPAALPTDTPVPTIQFWADRTDINAGECAELWWKTENVQAVWLYPEGEPYEEYPEIGEGKKQVCPETTTTYDLRVQLAEWVEIEKITIEVTP
jgi:hypothetical protein